MKKIMYFLKIGVGLDMMNLFLIVNVDSQS